MSNIFFRGSEKFCRGASFLLRLLVTGLVIASQRQWWRVSFVKQTRSLFFMKFIFENTDSQQ